MSRWLQIICHTGPHGGRLLRSPGHEEQYGDPSMALPRNANRTGTRGLASKVCKVLQRRTTLMGKAIQAPGSVHCTAEMVSAMQQFNWV